MDIKINAGRKAGPKGVYSHCETINIRATNAEESAWFARLARVFCRGGELVIREKAGEVTTLEFPGMGGAD